MKVQPTGNRHDYEELQDRLSFLDGRAGMFSVGGVTDFEIKERLVRIENAYNSAKAALEEGVLPGGGVALVRCSDVLDDVIAENSRAAARLLCYSKRWLRLCIRLPITLD